MFQIILDLRKPEDESVPVWIVLGSSLGGLLLLSFLVLALWKVRTFTSLRLLSISFYSST